MNSTLPSNFSWSDYVFSPLIIILLWLLYWRLWTEKFVLCVLSGSIYYNSCVMITVFQTFVLNLKLLTTTDRNAWLLCFNIQNHKFKLKLSKHNNYLPRAWACTCSHVHVGFNNNVLHPSCQSVGLTQVLFLREVVRLHASILGGFIIVGCTWSIEECGLYNNYCGVHIQWSMQDSYIVQSRCTVQSLHVQTCYDCIDLVHTIMQIWNSR